MSEKYVSAETQIKDISDIKRLIATILEEAEIKDIYPGRLDNAVVKLREYIVKNKSAGEDEVKNEAIKLYNGNRL